MRRLCLLVGLWATVAVAQQPTLSVPVTNPGEFTFLVKEGRYYYVDFEALTFRPVTLTFLTAPGPVPDPTPDPRPRADTIRDLTLSITADPQRSTTALALAGAFRGIAGKIERGQLVGYASISLAMKTDSFAVLGTLPREVVNSWEPVRAAISDYLVAMIQEGKPDAEYGVLCQDIALGLTSAGAKR